MILKRIMFIIFFVLGFHISILWSFSSGDKSSEIKIDGITSDFNTESDQILLSPDFSGIFFESDNDSRWGSLNDVSQIKLTWDKTYLYIAADGICSGNNMILYLDSGQSRGVTKASALSSWKRNFVFDGFSPDFFLAAGDYNPYPEFWQVLSSGVNENLSSLVESSASFNGSVSGCMEVKIPWDVLYKSGAYNIRTNAELKIAAVVAGGDGCSGPDSAPDSSDTMPSDCSKSVSLDNYLLIPLDQNSDGIPDMNADIRSRTSVKIDMTSLKYQPLVIDNIKIGNKSFSPDGNGIHDAVTITYRLSKDAEITAEVFHFKTGKCIAVLQDKIKMTAGEQQVQWNGYGDSSVKQPEGLYIIVIKAEALGIALTVKEMVYLID